MERKQERWWSGDWSTRTGGSGLLRQLAKPARVGMEATGYGRWFERMLAEQGHELWIGHASEIRAGVVRKQKTDARDAAHLLRLLAEERFPRIWIPSPAERDLRQLLRHRYKLVCFRVSVKNQLHGLAMSQGSAGRRNYSRRRGARNWKNSRSVRGPAGAAQNLYSFSPSKPPKQPPLGFAGAATLCAFRKGCVAIRKTLDPPGPRFTTHTTPALHTQKSLRLSRSTHYALAFC